MKYRLIYDLNYMMIFPLSFQMRGVIGLSRSYFSTMTFDWFTEALNLYPSSRYLCRAPSGITL